jgi:UDP-2,3-diacylglucosamine pyrophosphatase LpxH
MKSTFEEIAKEWDNDAEQKRKKVLEKIKKLDSAELQVIYQSLFLDEIMQNFEDLPEPSKPLSSKEINDAIFKSRKERGFYTKNSD